MKEKEIELSQIKVKENIREDYGDLDELTASIKSVGVRHPIELDEGNEVVDGHRRIKASKAAGLKKIPYFVSENNIGKTQKQITAGIFHKNLNPIEEGKAFRKLMDEYKLTAKEVAKHISKSEAYVDKRLVIINLPSEVQDALIGNKIQIGHALLLSKLTDQDGKKHLKTIISEKQSVEAARDNIQYSNLSMRLVDAPFDKSVCKGCKSNGSEQTSLFETGKILNGNCMNPGCFNLRIKEFVKDKREKFKEVLFKGENDYDDPKGFVEQGSYNEEASKITSAYKKKLRSEMNPENYLVRVTERGAVEEFFMPPQSNKKKETDEKSADVNRLRKVDDKVREFKRDLMIQCSQDLTLINDAMKAAVVYHLIKETDYEKLNDENFVKKLFELKTKDLESTMATLSKNVFETMPMEVLEIAAKKTGVDFVKHFQMTDGFLLLFTKDRMIKLAKELKIDVSKCKNNSAYRMQIISHWKPGQVPKIMGVLK